uniref:Chitin-binding type-2 domain-containing protein n=1 Tax=Steinernema glaseri TaxID=37863 RepID=A0A1I8A1G9_9BILA
MKAIILLLALLVLVANARPPPKCDPFVEYCRPFKAGPWLTPPFRPPTANVPRSVRPPGCNDGILSADCFPFKAGRGCWYDTLSGRMYCA